MKRTAFIVAAALAAHIAKADAAPADWENPAVNSWNRLPARTWSVPLASEEAALTGALEPETPYIMTLDGDWRFKWTGDPARRPPDFWRPDFDDGDWGTIDVPSCVEMRGWGSPVYTNTRYPHANKWPLIRDRDSGRADNNPVSSYRRVFTVPEGWSGRDVILRFEGVGSAFTVWINGERAGYAEDSKLPSEFDITPFLKPGENLIAVEAFKWCDGSYLEDQDMFRYSGIFRSVFLWAKPKDGIWDFAVRTSISPDFKTASVKIEGFDGDASLYDGKTKLASLTVENPKLWSAEKPYLYTLVLKKGDDIRMKRIGFKTQKIEGNRLLVNGKPVKFKGVNRHETNPENGRTVTLDDMVKDILLMKRHNIDTVRTCHYPDHRLWYDLCDRYGIYVIAEANVEGHEPGYGDKGLGRFPEWDHTIVERNERQAIFYRNNPCVTVWSMGNETGHGDCFRHAIAAVKKIDATRPVHWERGNEDADIDSSMYPSVEWVEDRGKSGDKPGGKPYIMCEYAHAMGNALGNFKEYWDAIYAHESLAGGCIWDWADQAIWKETDRIDPSTGKRERYLAYGGDFDDSPNDGPFCCNGVVDPLRNESAKLKEVAHVHRNLAMTRNGDGAFELWNRHLFTFSDEFKLRWVLLEDGVEIAGGDIPAPRVAPLGRAAIEIPGLTEAMMKADLAKEHFVNIWFETMSDSLWAPAGHVVARDQILMNSPAPAPAAAAPAPKMFVEESAGELTVECARTTAIFSRETGTLRALFMKGVNVIDNPAPGIPGGPQLTCMRAATDNDRWMSMGDPWGENRKKSYYSSGLTQLKHHPGRISVTNDEVRVVIDVAGCKGCGFTHECVYSFASDGSMTMKNKVTPYGVMPPALPRLGLTWRLPPRLEMMRYYGRGPWENYVDRNSASFLGLWESTVTAQFTEYVRPQDNGFKTDVRWVEFFDKSGKGVRFCASEPMKVQALHYGWEDLEFSRHILGQRRYRSPLRPREEIVLNLDVRQTGLGGASCGPVPMDKYRFDPSEPVEWSVTVSPIGR
ncbi:MAG: DUF4981 domain-containing protein [Kiritimatiellae bacterium]|nr:DUF4981 domain-containing protein [Kiritimatiellia bacterium]